MGVRPLSSIFLAGGGGELGERGGHLAERPDGGELGGAVGDLDAEHEAHPVEEGAEALAETRVEQQPGAIFWIYPIWRRSWRTFWLVIFESIQFDSVTTSQNFKLLFRFQSVAHIFIKILKFHVFH